MLNAASKPGSLAANRNLHISLALFVALTPFAAAQTESQTETQTTAVQTAPAPQPAVEQARLELPDSPGSLLSAFSSSSSSTAVGSERSDEPDTGQSAPAVTPKHAPHLEMTVYPGELADPMTVHEKIVGGLKSSVSLFSATGWLAAAGWEQLWNDSPNYGTDAGAFGQRLGAAAIRGISEGIFSDSLFAPLFHEDPRYYVMGKGHGFFKRAIYAGTRTIISRTDSGHAIPNFSLLAGNLAGSALTIPYYPSQNTSFSEVAMTFGGSIGGSAMGYLVDEFFINALVELHIKKK